MDTPHLKRALRALPALCAAKVAIGLCCALLVLVGGVMPDQGVAKGVHTHTHTFIRIVCALRLLCAESCGVLCCVLWVWCGVVWCGVTQNPVSVLFFPSTSGAALSYLQWAVWLFSALLTAPALWDAFVLEVFIERLVTHVALHPFRAALTPVRATATQLELELALDSPLSPAALHLPTLPLHHKLAHYATACELLRAASAEMQLTLALLLMSTFGALAVCVAQAIMFGRCTPPHPSPLLRRPAPSSAQGCGDVCVLM